MILPTMTPLEKWQQIKELEFKQRYNPLYTIDTKEWIDKDIKTYD